MTTSTSKHLSLAALCIGGLLLAGCPPAPTPDPLEPMPRVLSFTGSADEVPIGGNVTLRWQVENATEVKVEELSFGTLSGIEGLEGSVDVAVTANALFVLTARNARGATDSAVVSVRVQGEPSGLLFVASKDAIEAGEAVTLAWSAPGATAVSITGSPGGSIDLAGQLQTGAVVVRPSTSTRYTITAGGRTATVDVAVSGGITSFTVTPTVAEPGSTVRLSWTTANAERVQLLTPGRSLHDSTDPADVAAGSFDDVLPAVVDPSQLFSYELRVTTGAVTLKRTVMVTIPGSPSVISFTAPALAKRGAGNRLTLSWETFDTDSVSITANGVEIYRSPGRAIALAGSTTLPVPADDTTFVLTASNARGGSATATAIVDSVGLPTVTLTAAPQAVQGGDQVTLSWTGQDVRSLTISNSTTGLAVARRGVLDTGTATVRVNADATFTLVASNGLGDEVTSTASVMATSPVTLSVAQSGDLRLGENLSVTASRAGALIGLPHRNLVVNPASSGFIDIVETGTPVVFPASGNIIGRIDSPFRTVFFGRTVGQQIRVSHHGYLVFGDYLNGDNTDYETLPTAKLEPMAVAPHWYSMSSSKVYWEVRASGGSSTLIVQWVYSTTANVQAKISSTGQIDFEYANASTSAKAGVTGPTLAYTVAAPTPADGSGVTFFGPLPQPVQVPVLQTGRISAAVELSPGEAVRAEGTLVGTVVHPDELVLTEALSRTSLGANGQWLELTNWRQRPIDLNGWSFTLADGGVLPLTSTIPPRSTLVFGATTDPALNADAGVQVALAGFDLTGARSVALTRGGVQQTLSLVQADGGFPDAGSSITFDPGPFRYASGNTTPQGARSCVGPGRPGVDQGCGFPYAKSTIPVGYYDISDPLYAVSFVADKAAMTSLSLSAAPVPFFGVNQLSMVVTTNGLLSFDENSTTATQYFTGTIPVVSDSNSALAIFADQLQLSREIFPDSNVYARRIGQGQDPFADAPHWIIQWHHVSHTTTTLTSRDDLNFQVKLFDDGVIEYHFGELRGGGTTTTSYASGQSAVTWLEAPGGTSALVINANTAVPGILPNTAIRFTPRSTP